jgi:AcrR family transcriptional regulator
VTAGGLRRGPGLLDRPSIVAVALGVARTEGLDALTMRRIADELGRSPMSLYRHVADRQALVLAMLDEVAAQIVLPAPVNDPRADITAVLHAAHAAMREDAWVVTALVRDGLASPLILPVVERLFAALARAGLLGERALSAHQLIWEFAYGELLVSHHDRPDAWNRRMMRESDPVAYPALHAAMRAAPATPPADRFAAHLQILLDGLLTRKSLPNTDSL